MALSYDVRLPKARPPIFPDRCVACGREEPGAFIKVTTHAIGWWTVAFLHPGRSFSTSAPACPPCKRRLRRQRWTRIAVLALWAVPAVMFAAHLVGSYGGPFRKWIGVGVGLLFLLPILLWEALHAPAIDLTAYSDEVDYEFADPAYAEEFAELNGTRVSD